jgi:hypothetical protein
LYAVDLPAQHTGVHLCNGESAFELPFQSRRAGVKKLSLSQLVAEARQQALSTGNTDHQVLNLRRGIEKLFRVSQKMNKFLSWALVGKTHLGTVVESL